MNHITVIGFMGSGKTKVGKQLAKDLQMPFVDLDKKIVKDMKMTMNEIFDRFGEPFFRALETRALKEFLETKEDTVISVGSGLPIQEQNKKYLKQLGTVVYLRASVEVLKSRLEGDSSRPMLKGGKLDEKISRLLTSRAPVYEELADIIVDTGVKPFADLISEIKEKLAASGKNS